MKYDVFCDDFVPKNAIIYKKNDFSKSESNFKILCHETLVWVVFDNC